MQRGDDQPVHYDPQREQDRNLKRDLMNYQFSPEELRILKECNYESFFQRSLPLGTAFGVAAFYGIKSGYLKPNLKYGPAPKVLVGVIVGYFLGKISYQVKCAEKLMQLPNSRLAEMLKMRRKGRIFDNFTPDQGFGSGFALAPFNSPTDQYSDEYTRSNSLNLDTERPSHSGLDDTHRPSIDGNSRSFEDTTTLEPPKSQTTYDELRQKNRDEYAKKKQVMHSRSILQDTPPPIIRPQEQFYPSDPPRTSGSSKNKYGDEWTQ